MPKLSLGSVDLFSSWPIPSLWTKVNLPADWLLAPVRSTAMRRYGNKILEVRDVGLAIQAGSLQGWSIKASQILIFDQQSPWFLPDNFYVRDVRLTPRDHFSFRAGQLGSRGSLDFELFGAEGIGHYLTMLPGINSGTSPAEAEDAARLERLELAMQPFLRTVKGRLELSDKAYGDPEFRAAHEAVKTNNRPGRLQGLFSISARSTSFSIHDALAFSVTGSDALPGFRAEYSLDYDPFAEAARVLDNRAYICLENVSASVRIGASLLFSLSSASLPDRPDVEIRAGNWGLQPDAPLLQIAQLSGSFTLLPLRAREQAWPAATPSEEDRPLYASAQISGLQVQQDGDLFMDAARIEIPEGALASLGLAGVVPLDLQQLELDFARAADGSIDLKHTTLRVTGQVNAGLLETQLRALTNSPDLSLSLLRWTAAGARPLSPSESLSLAFRIDQASGALRCLEAPALRLDLRDLVLPLPDGHQASFQGSLILGGTDANGAVLPIPAALLLDAGVASLLPAGFVAAEALLAGDLRSVRGDSRAAAVLSGSLNDSREGSTLQLDGQVRLEGSLLSDSLGLGGAIEAAFSWRLDARRTPAGTLALSGFPTIRGIGLENIRFEVSDVLRLSVHELAWTAEPRMDPSTGSPGLVARARGLDLEWLRGALAGQTFRSRAAEVLLFDLQGDDGIPDHFHVDGLDLSAATVGLGPLRADGLRLRLASLTNLPDPASGSSGLRGWINLEADRARLQVGEAFSAALLPAAADLSAAGSRSVPPALTGAIDLTSGAIRVTVQRFEASLALAGQELIQLQAEGSAAADPLRLDLPADASADAVILRIPSLAGTLPLLAVDGPDGRRSPALQLEGLAVQRDGDLELGAISLLLPEGYARQWALGGLVPLELLDLAVRFDPRPDGSADLSRPLIRLRGRLNPDRLERQLRELFAAPDLVIRLERFGSDAQLHPQEASSDINLDARLDASSGVLKLLNSPGWRLRLDGLPLPLPGEAPPLLAGDLLLPGTDADGNLQPLPAPLLRSLLEETGVSAATTAALIANPAPVLALLRGALNLENGESTSLFAADGRLILAGGLSSAADGASRLSLAGEALLSSALQVPGLKANADLSAAFHWDLRSTPEVDGAIRLDGAFRLGGARLQDLDFQLDGLLALQIGSLAWISEPLLDQVGDALTPGLIARGTGLSLQLLAGPLEGLRLGSPDTELRLYDLDGDDGVVDHAFLDGEALSIRDLDLGWLKAQRIALDLKAITNLPALDPDPSDAATLSGVIDLALETAVVGTDLRFERAAGRYDLSRNSLALSLDGLNWSGFGAELRGLASLVIDPAQPAERRSQLQAQGTLKPGLAGLRSLAGQFQLSLDPDLTLTRIEGLLSAAVGEGWLGDLELLGALRFRYDTALNQATLGGEVRLAGLNAEATIRFTPGEDGFQAALRISNQSRLDLADWLQLSPSALELLYTYSPERGGRLDLDGRAGLNLFGRALDVGVDLQVGFGAEDRRARLLGGGLQLLNPLEGVSVAGFGVDLIADRAGHLPAIRLEPAPAGPIPRLNGALRLRDLNDLTIELDPQSGSISYSSNGWSFDRFDLDLTPSGPLDLGLLQLGDGARLRYSDGLFSLDPDLAVNGVLLGRVLAPVARVIDATLAPMTNPVLAVLQADINLDPLRNLDRLRPGWVWSWAWDPIVSTGQDLHAALISTFEATPANPYRDGRLQVVEVLDACQYFLFKLLKQNPTLATLLAEQFGLPASYVTAVIAGAPFVSAAAAVASLAAIADLAARVNRAEAEMAASDVGSFVRIPELSFRFRPGQVSETLGSIGAVAAEDSAVIKALLDVQRAWQANAPLHSAPGSSVAAGSLFSASSALQVPLIDDTLASVLRLLKGEALDVIQVQASLQANLFAEVNQSIPVAIGPVLLPLSLGVQGRLSGALNAALGLTTSRSALLQFGLELTTDPAAALANLLAPLDRDGLGVYLAGQSGRPLLWLEPMLRIQGGLDGGIAAVRAFAGLQGSLDVRLAAQRLYLGSLVKTLSGSTPPKPEELGRLFSLDANVSALFGIDTKIGSWSNLLSTAWPLYRLSVPRVFSGPVLDAEVLFDERIYDAAGALTANLNLRADSGEIFGRTDSQGAYRFEGAPDPERIGNRDGRLDFRDGMVIVGQPNGRSSGQSISLIDSISGADLGIPLVGLPGGPITLLTTLKYSSLLRWNPERTVAGQPLTPELITALFATIVKDAPAAFQNDTLEPYQAIASGDAQLQAEGLQTLIFSYQHLAAVLTILELFRSLELDYGNPAAWGFVPDGATLEAPERVAFTAYGSAIRSLFGRADSSGANPLDPIGRPPLAAQFEISNVAHIRAVLRDVLSAYPTQTLFALADRLGERESLRSDFIQVGRSLAQQQRVERLIEAVFGPQLDNIASGLTAITATIQERLQITQDLSTLIPIAGSQLIAASIAGPKRLVLTELIPGLIRAAATSNPEEFRQSFASLFYTPTTVDAAARSRPFLIRASSRGAELNPVARLDRQVPLERVSVSILLTDPEGGAVESPDYGLTIRFRLGGSVEQGVHYLLPEAFRSHLAYVPPGASRSTVELDLLPAFFEAENPLLQLELLSADSGFRVDPDAAVVSLQLADAPLGQLDGSRRSFQHQALVQGIEGMPNQLVAARGQANPVLRGVNGRADTFVLRPELEAMPHLENFRPQEGDRLLIDPQSLSRMRAAPGLRSRSEAVRGEAFRQLEAALGQEAIGSLSAEALAARLEALMEALDPLPAPRLEQLNTYGGLLFDLVSRRPLALLSDRDGEGQDLAWSALSTDPQLGAIALMPSLRRAGSDPTLLTLGDPMPDSAADAIVLRASLNGRALSANQIVYVVLEAKEVERADTLLADLDRLRSRARTLFTSLEASDVTLPEAMRFEREISLRRGESIRFFEITAAELGQLSSRSDSRLRPLHPDGGDGLSGSVQLSSGSGLRLTLELQDQQPSLASLIADQQTHAPLLDFSRLPPATSLQGTLLLAREADFDAITGFYRILDPQGTVLSGDRNSLVRPGEPGYSEAALAAHNRVQGLSDLSVEDNQVRSRSFALSEAAILAPYSQIKGQTLFAFAAANPDGISHFRSLGTNTIGMEDMLGGGDHDFDDLVFRFSLSPF